MARDPRSVLPLNPRAFYILVALAAEQSHGYAIAKSVEAATDGVVRLTAGTLYPLIRQMLADGWIAECGAVRDQDPRRRMYRLTPWGTRIAQAEALRLAQAVRMASKSRLIPAEAFA
ncbi:MAG TPA: PadR family transcriptional regulator [Candidatus Baltobacteraceae bacterium]|nr:PadR family transcriptional regulator [Candidatus Baltobacteraceae bacterium]